MIFSHEFPPFGGGAGVVAKHYAKKLSDEGNEVTVLTKKIDKIDFNVNYKIKLVKNLKKLWILAYIKAVNFDAYDQIILNDNSAVYFAGVFFSHKQLSNSTAFLHGSEPEDIFEKPNIIKKLFAFKHFYTNALNRIHSINAVSSYMKEKFLKRTKLHHLESKIKITYTSVEPDIFYPDFKENFNKKLNLPIDATIILSVSRIVKGKGFFEMFEIFKQLSQTNDCLYWIIIGTGNYVDTLKKFAKDAGLKSKIIFIGAVDRGKLRAYYSNASVFWLLSNLDESFGLVYLEAQACACPVIGRNRAGVKEVIENRKSGFLVNNHEAVIDILENKKYLELKKEDILKFSNNFHLMAKTQNILSE